jgi:protein-tyrosine-phosphatase
MIPPNARKSSLQALALAGLITCSSLGAETMTNAESREAHRLIAMEHQNAKQACSVQNSNAKDVCLQEAKGAYKVARAELENKDEPSARHQRNLGVARADSTYHTANERCDDANGAAKSACRADAKSARKAALLDIK